MSDAWARNADPSTAHDAAESMRHGEATRLEAVLFAFLKKRGTAGATSEEAASELGISRVTISPRFRPLANKGFILDSGEKRLGNSGRRSIVWVVNDSQTTRPTVPA